MAYINVNTYAVFPKYGAIDKLLKEWNSIKMKNIIFILAMLLMNSVATYGQNFNGTNRIIFKLKNEFQDSVKSLRKQKSIGNNRIDSVTQRFHAVKVINQSTGKKSNQNIHIIQFPEGTNIQQVIDAYYKTGIIEYAEPDYVGSGGGMPNDQYYFRQWGLKNDGTFSLLPSTPGADIDMEKAWDIEQGDSNIVVAIIDSGVKLDHPELAGRIWNNYNEIPDNGIDDDGNGYVDDVQGWDFANSDMNPTDDYGHGTNVAGIIGANGNNSIGYAGVDWNCKLMILKALDNNNYGFYSWWASAIYYAVDNGAKVINMSLGGSSTSSTLKNAIKYAINNGVVVVACMMNTNSNTIFYPAGFSGVIAVGSTDPDDTRSNPFFWSSTSGSNFGSHISVVAPGNYIYGLNYQSNTNYNSYWGGTSQATPYVTGLASLLLAQDPTRTPAQIKSIIEATAEDQVGNPSEDTPGWDQYFGYGRINAFNALSVNLGSTTSSQTATACDSYTWNGNTYTTSGTYRDTIPNTAGCDSLMILNLTINNSTSSSQTITACDGYTWNGNTYTTSGTYRDTIPNVAGCDSLMILNLTINNSTSSSQTITACDSYTWNGNTYTTSGTYRDTIPNTAGCDSLMTLNLTINTVDTSVAVAGSSLTANAVGATYQWLNCDINYAVISGATNQTYTPTVTGNYAVEVTENGCTDTSSCYNLTITGIKDPIAVEKFVVYPNPTSGVFTIERGTTQHIHYELTNIIGKSIRKGALTDKQTTIDLSEYDNGIYLLNIDGETETVKLVKH